MVSKDTYDADEVDDEENIVTYANLQEASEAVEFEPFAWNEGTDMRPKPDQSIRYDLVTSQFTVDQEHWKQNHEPKEVLGSDNFVKDHKCPGLDGHGEIEVVIESKACHDDDCPLRDEHQKGDQLRPWLIKELVDQVPVD